MVKDNELICFPQINASKLPDPLKGQGNFRGVNFVENDLSALLFYQCSYTSFGMQETLNFTKVS
jgi:hypothetical protein